MTNASTNAFSEGSCRRSDYAVLPWIIWGLAALFYAYEFFLQVSPSVMVPDLMAAFHIDAATLGNLGALYFYAYAIMQIPSGVLLDTLGPRRLLTAASAICVIGAMIFGFAHALWMAQLGRLMIGFGSAFAAIGSFKLASNWFPLDKFAFITGLTVMIGMTGAVIGGAPLAFLVHHVGWRQSMFILGIIGLGISVLIWSIVRDSPNQFNNEKAKHHIPQVNLTKSLVYIFRQKQSWLTAIYGGLMFAPTSAFAAMWGVPFLMTKYHLHSTVAAGAISMIFVGWVVSSPICGWISDYIRRRKPTLYFAAMGALITISMITYTTMPITLLYATLFCFGVFSAGFLPSFSIIREISPPNTNATALGFMNMMNMVGGASLQPLIGWLLDKHWAGEMHNHVRVFSLHAYHSALIILPIILALALIITPFIRETHCKQVSMDCLNNHNTHVDVDSANEKMIADT